MATEEEHIVRDTSPSNSDNDHEQPKKEEDDEKGDDEEMEEEVDDEEMQEEEAEEQGIHEQENEAIHEGMGDESDQIGTSSGVDTVASNLTKSSDTSSQQSESGPEAMVQ